MSFTAFTMMMMVIPEMDVCFTLGKRKKTICFWLVIKHACKLKCWRYVGAQTRMNYTYVVHRQRCIQSTRGQIPRIPNCLYLLYNYSMKYHWDAFVLVAEWSETEIEKELTTNYSRNWIEIHSPVFILSSKYLTIKWKKFLNKCLHIVWLFFVSFIHRFWGVGIWIFMGMMILLSIVTCILYIDYTYRVICR